VADPNAVACADDPARERGAVADVGLDPREGVATVGDRDQVGDVEEAFPPRGDAVADGGCAERVLDRKGLEPQPRQLERPPKLDHSALGDAEARNRIEGDRGREDGTGATAAQTAGVVLVGVREQDRPRGEPPDGTRPVDPAVDHHDPVAGLEREHAVTAVGTAADLDLAAGAQECRDHPPHRGSRHRRDDDDAQRISHDCPPGRDRRPLARTAAPARARGARALTSRAP
jgi:hypothetical protein